MAITSVSEDATQREVTWTDDGMALVHSYVIIVDAPVTNTVALTGAVGLPFRGDEHPFNPIAFVEDVSITQRSGSMTVFDAVITYKTFETPPLDANPLLRPAEIQWTSITTQESFQQDVDGKPVVNSAGVPFDPPSVRDFTRPVLTITRNEADFAIGGAINFYDTVNLNPFFGATQGQAKLSGISAERLKENAVDFWRITYTFHFRKKRWDELSLLDQGLDALVLEGGKVVLKAITRLVIDPVTQDKTWIPITDPVPLNGIGGVLPHGDDVFYGTYATYLMQDFGLLEFE